MSHVDTQPQPYLPTGELTHVQLLHAGSWSFHQPNHGMSIKTHAALSRYIPFRFRTASKAVSESCPFRVAGNTKLIPLKRGKAFNRAIAASDRGTRCSFAAFIRLAGMVHVLPSRLISLTTRHHEFHLSVLRSVWQTQAHEEKRRFVHVVLS